MSNTLDTVAAEIDQLLADQRPDRYEPHGGDEWLDTVASQIVHMIPAATARQRVAGQIVRDRERAKTRSTNKLLREIHKSGEFPLGWLDSSSLPLAVGKVRVRLSDVTVDDLRDFAANERRNAAAEFTARNETCEAAEWLADQMEATGTDHLTELEPL